MNTDKAVLDEITRRVFELEGEQRHFERHGEELEAHTEALAEVSRLPRHKIEAIAYALTHDERLRPQRGQGFWRPLAVTLAIAGMVGVLFFVNRPMTPVVPAQTPVIEPPKPQETVPVPPVQPPQPQETAPVPPAQPPQAITPPQPVVMFSPALQDLYVQRAALGNVFSMLSPLKTYLANYYAENGKHPESFEQLGLPDDDMNDGEYIKQVKILPEGVLRVELTEFFGTGMFLTLKQQAIMGGTQIKWQCESNLPQEILAIGYAGSRFCTQETP